MHIWILGDRSSEIRFDKTSQIWNWTDYTKPGMYATIEKPLKSMLMGRATADFTNLQVQKPFPVNCIVNEFCCRVGFLKQKGRRRLNHSIKISIT